MTAWVRVDEAFVLGAMPSELTGPYAAWIAKHPEKAGRLAEIARGVVSDFRTGLAANPTVAMAPGADELPERGVRHALTIVFYNLSLEMGLSINMSAQTAFINAEVYARQLYTSEAVIDREALGQTPLYEAYPARSVRAMA